MKGSHQVALVTGGNGFLGTALVRELTSIGVTVHALGNNRKECLADLLPSDCVHVAKSSHQVTDLVQEVNPSMIFHLAAVFKEPTNTLEMDAMMESNIRLGNTILFAALLQKKRPAFINAGTFWQLGDNNASSPKSLYAATKRAFHDLLMYYREEYHLPTVTLILYDTYGRDDPRGKLWSQLVAAGADTEFPLTEGEQFVHLVHIRDVVRAFIKAAELLHEGHPLESVHSVHSLQPRKLKDLVTELNDRAGLDLKLRWGARPYPQGQIFQPWVGQALPGWEPSVDVLQCLVEDASIRRGETELRGVRVG